MPGRIGSSRGSTERARVPSTVLWASGCSKPRKRFPATIGEPRTAPSVTAPGRSRSTSAISLTGTSPPVARSAISCRTYAEPSRRRPRHVTSSFPAASISTSVTCCPPTRSAAREAVASPASRSTRGGPAGFISVARTAVPSASRSTKASGASATCVLLRRSFRYSARKEPPPALQPAVTASFESVSRPPWAAQRAGPAPPARGGSDASSRRGRDAAAAPRSAARSTKSRRVIIRAPPARPSSPTSRCAAPGCPSWDRPRRR